METFFVAYTIVWLAVLGFVLRLGVRQRRLTRALESLEARMEAPRQPDGRSVSEAA
jgi:CcmD family protein